VSRLGLGTFVLALIAFLIPLVYALLGVTGVIQLNSWADINNLVSGAIVVGIVAFLLATLATLLNLPGVLSSPRHSGGALIASVLLLLLAAGFLFGVVPPRVADIQHIEYTELPFLQVIYNSCETPLKLTIEDLETIRNFADSTRASDSGYAGGIGTYIAILHADDAKLADGIQAIQQATVPSPQYQTLKDQCLKALKDKVNFLDNPSAVSVDSPLDRLLGHTVSGFALLTASGDIAATGKLPNGTVQTFVIQVLVQANPQLSISADISDIVVKGVNDRLNQDTSPLAVPRIACGGGARC
jgi:hypothetical protein